MPAKGVRDAPAICRREDERAEAGAFHPEDGERVVPATLCEPKARPKPTRPPISPTHRGHPTAPAASDPGRWDETAALVVRSQDGDREAFGLLAEQFQRTVYAISLRRLGDPTEALELSQEVFLHAMTRIGQLREPERFAGWLRQMVVRMAINRATRRVPPPSVEDEVLDASSGIRDEPVEALIARERIAGLRAALARLNQPLCRCVSSGSFGLQSCCAFSECPSSWRLLRAACQSTTRSCTSCSTSVSYCWQHTGCRVCACSSAGLRCALTIGGSSTHAMSCMLLPCGALFR